MKDRVSRSRKKVAGTSVKVSSIVNVDYKVEDDGFEEVDSEESHRMITPPDTEGVVEFRGKPPKGDYGYEGNCTELSGSLNC